jgi:GNAT superfamily N-acetyltransferase
MGQGTRELHGRYWTLVGLDSLRYCSSIADGLFRHLAPLWVVPDQQRRGVASLLLRDGIELADKEQPSPPMYLEAMPDARVIYERFGYRGVEGEGKDFVMVRNPPEGVKLLEKEKKKEE